MATWRRVVDENERKVVTTAALNLQTTGFTWQERSSSSKDTRLRLSDYAGAETRSGDCNREAQDISGALLDDNPDGNSFDFYVGIASTIGLSLVFVVAIVTAVSISLLIERRGNVQPAAAHPPTPASKLVDVPLP
jgi:hypothetical protein